MSQGWSEAMQEIDFAAQATSSDRRVQVRLTGNADLNVQSQLGRFLREVHSQAQRCVAEEVTVDVRELKFMNSSCLKSFVWWISIVQEQADDRKYRIVFVSSPTVYWQRRSLNALAGLANGIISIQA